MAHTIATRAGSRQTDNFIKESWVESKQSMATTSLSASTAQTAQHQQSAPAVAETQSQKSSQAEGGEK